MSSVVLTDRLIAKAIAKHRASSRDRVVLRDAVVKGLRLTLGHHGAVWAYTRTVRQDGARRELFVTLGRLGAMSLAEARQKAAALRDEMIAGRDPVVELKLVRAQETTLAVEATRWTPRGKPQTQTLERLNLDLCLREMNVVDKPPGALKAADIVALIIDRHRERPASARNRFFALRRFADHLVEKGLLKVNPCAEVPRRFVPKPPPGRSTYPTAVEVQGLWRAAEQFPAVQRDFVRLALLLPLRRNELANLTMKEVDLAGAEIKLPSARMKAGRAFVMPLSTAALDILRPHLDGLDSNDLVLPLKAPGAAGFGWQPFLAKLRMRSGAASFRLHDTRRLFVSEAAEHHLADFDLLDSLLAHSQSASRGGILGLYQRSKRAPERRRAVEEWSRLVQFAVAHGQWPRERARGGDVLLKLTSRGGEVVPLRPRSEPVAATAEEPAVEPAAPALNEAAAFVPIYTKLRSQGWTEAEIAATYSALYAAALAAGQIVPARPSAAATA